MSYQHYERLYDFSGGLNNRDADFLLQNNESPDMCNVVLGKRGTFETRPGTALFRDVPVNEEEKPVTTIYEHVTPDGSYFLAFAGGELKIATGDGWEEIENADAEFEGLDEKSCLKFAGNPVINKSMFVNGKDGFFETDGQTFNEVDPYEPDSEPPEGDPEGGSELIEIGACVIPEEPKLICYHKYRTWLANVKDYPDRIYCSVDDIVGNKLYNYFTTTSWYRASNTRGEGVTALISFKERLYVFTRTTIKVIVGDDLDNFMMGDIDGSVGAVSSRCVWPVGEYLIFLGVDGVYMFDGINPPMKVSIRLTPTISRIASEHRDRACGIMHQGKYYLSVPESTVNDLTLVYDTEVVPLTYIGEKHSYANSPWTMHRGYTPTQWLAALDQNLYFASDDGYIYQYGIGDTDAGRPINAYLTTKFIDLQMPDRTKRVRRLILDARREKDSFIRVDYKIDAEDNDWKLFRENIDLSQPIDRMFFYFPDGRGPLCRKIAFKFSTIYLGSKYRINGFTLDMAVHGHQEERGG
jgi:hypothetical protein